MPPALARTVGRDCRAVWGRRDDLRRSLVGQATLERDRAWRDDLAEVGDQLARLTRGTAESDAISAEVRSLAGAPRADPGTAWRHVVAGRALLSGGDSKGAAAEFDRACRLDPALLWGHYGRGVALLSAGDPTAAREAFTTAIALAPGAAWCWYNRGLAERQCGRTESAAADFERASRLDPDFWLARLELAACHERAGRTAAAAEALGRATAAGAPAPAVADRAASPGRPSNR